MKFNRAASRMNAARGSSFLTKGSDDYDHSALNSARRSMDKAIIAEQLIDDDSVDAEPKQSGQFKVVVYTQVRENYGAHDWDGVGDVPQYWKCKGGSEYHHLVGSWQDVVALGSTGIKGIVDAIVATLGNNEYYREDVIDWEVVDLNYVTYEQAMIAEMLADGYISDEQAAFDLQQLWVNCAVESC